MKIIDVRFEAISTLVLELNLLALLGLLVIFIIVCKLIGFIVGFSKRSSIEIDEVELGIGNSKIKLKYDSRDREIAYKLWVELNTRKIGLVYDEDNDVLVDVYNSWYEFFKVSRELLKAIPQSKLASTPQLIELSLEILNVGLRPHLTKWQAKFRKWYSSELLKNENDKKTPQEIQRQYAYYDELIADLKLTNQKMVQYKNLLYEIAFEKQEK